jgi:hypothetical protein
VSNQPVRKGRPRFSDAQLVRALKEANAATTGPLTVGQYSAWREEQSARGTRRHTDLPAYTTIHRRFGGFRAALEAAGLDVGHMAPLAEGSRFSNEQLLRVLYEADLAVGGRLSVHRYHAWREAESAGDRAVRSALPTNTTFILRFGGWTRAVEQMRQWRKNQ